MKFHNRSILFALVLAASACGGDRKTDFDPMYFVPKPAPRQVQKPVASAPVAPAPVKPAVDDHSIPTTYDAALAQGRAMAEKGEHDRARELFEAAIKLDKKSADPHIELARLYITTGERALAVAAANKAVKLAPLSSQAWNTKGRAELNRFDYDAAIEAFSKSVEINADNVWAWNNLGFTELQLKKYDEAAEHLTEATSRKGATGFMFNNLGTALEQLDRLDEARTAFDAGSKLGSKEAIASRKRLDGVKSIALAKVDTSAKLNVEVKPDVKTTTKTFDLDEGQVEVKAVDETKVEPKSDESKDDGDVDKDLPATEPSDAGVKPASESAPQSTL